MSIYKYIYDPERWKEFFEDFAANEHKYKADIKKLKNYIETEAYLPIIDNYEKTGFFPAPQLIMLNKKGTEKKRAVFSFDEEVSWLLKFIGYYLHTFDDMFSDNLYSFRRERSVKTAVARLLKQKNISTMYGVKLDIHDYFNSADTGILLEKIRTVIDENDHLMGLFERILRDESVVNDSQELMKSPVKKGMMAGSPLSPFLANLYLDEMDKHFDGINCFYARYSDDIILFCQTEEKLRNGLEYISQYLKDNGLTLNPDKQSFINPGEPFEFLGFLFDGDCVDVAKASFEKIKKKLKRKSRAVLRWKIKKLAEPEKAARVYIRYFNRKFFENPIKSELTWCRWYFPIITTDVSLKEIDHYMQECIRFIYTGKHTKRNYNLRYDEMRKLGYRSLVNEYHKK